MSTPLKEFLQRWAINTVAVLLASYVVSSGIHYQRPMDLLLASLCLGLLNTFARPILVALSLPLVLLSLGLFMLFINALLLYFVGWLLKPAFRVDTFGAAFWGALVITLVSVLLSALTGVGGSKIKITRGPIPPKDRRDGGDDGPVIDV